jgi:hypothetical protein
VVVVMRRYRSAQTRWPSLRSAQYQVFVLPE